MKGKKLLLVLMLILSLVLSACSDKPSSSSSGKEEDGDKITLRMTWWGSQSRHDQTLEIIKLYEKENPHIKIEPEFTGFDGYFEKMAAQASGNNLPDIMQQNFGEYLNQYADKGLLADLTEFVENGTIDVEGVSETIMASGTQDGKLLGIPTGTNALAAIYDKAMLEEAGAQLPNENWTWEDFIAISTKVHEELDTYGTRLLEPGNIFEYYLREKGFKLFNEDGTDLGYDDDQLLEDFFTMNKDMVDKGVAPGYDVIQQIKGVEDELIVHGDAAFDIRWSNQVGALTSAAGKPLDLTLLPGEGNAQGMYLKPAMLWSVSESSKHKEEAAKFINFFINNSKVYEIGGSDRGVPIKQEMRDAMEPNLSEEDKKVFDYINLVAENSTPIDSNFPPAAAEVLQKLAEIDELVIYGELSPREGAKQFREQATEILNR
ncbi:sugar ABC transporter substrate-binding protein [uncultured Metabacillus sp.]|uniref:ABC transporter substrate-binding protein n=1 Tax=uncultured Metabacillus sp. TaxID=2860135 RepID=UPI00261D0066|nr:sugar ABC transporter substrate-binding protein [uncultured Metabacillus sp.]